jgi:C8 domain
VLNIPKGKIGRPKNAKFCTQLSKNAMLLFLLKNTTRCMEYLIITKNVLNKILYRCVEDACGCESGDDCHCLCSAVASYAQKCNENNVPIKWRTQETCRTFVIITSITSSYISSYSQQCSATSRAHFTVLASLLVQWKPVITH